MGRSLPVYGYRWDRSPELFVIQGKLAQVSSDARQRTGRATHSPRPVLCTSASAQHLRLGRIIRRLPCGIEHSGAFYLWRDDER